MQASTPPLLAAVHPVLPAARRGVDAEGFGAPAGRGGLKPASENTASRF